MAGGVVLDSVTGWAATCDNVGLMTKMPQGYSANHHRVYRERGAARDNRCSTDCGKQATQWAHLHDTDSADPANYTPMCRSCHAKYDGAVPPSQFGKKPANAGLSDEQAQQIRDLVASGVPQAEVARRYGLARQGVWRIVHGVAYNRGVRS